jgi:hypothetical protein
MVTPFHIHVVSIVKRCRITLDGLGLSFQKWLRFHGLVCVGTEHQPKKWKPLLLSHLIRGVKDRGVPMAASCYSFVGS